MTFVEFGFYTVEAFSLLVETFEIYGKSGHFFLNKKCPNSPDLLLHAVRLWLFILNLCGVTAASAEENGGIPSRSNREGG